MPGHRWISPASRETLVPTEDGFKDGQYEYPVDSNGIPNFIFPRELPQADQRAKDFYDGRANDYEQYLHLTFETYGEDETLVRQDMVDLLLIEADSKVLEVACGTGRDSVHIAEKLSAFGQFDLTDISLDMILVAKEKLSKVAPDVTLCLSNAMYLPFPDNYYDAVYSFGAAGEFSDQTQFFSELVRVTKPGGKVVVGDENLPVWQRKTEFGRIVANYNPQFLAEVPFRHLPKEARQVRCQWVIGGVFYVLDFVVGEGEPYGNFDFNIPGVRGGTHRSRMYGNLEGVKEETKALALKAREKLGLSMHEWLDEMIRTEAEKVLKESDD